MQMQRAKWTTRFGTVLASLFFAAAWVSYPSAARAQACAGTEFEPKSVEIQKQPTDRLDCVTVSVEGTWYCGSSPFVVFRNECSGELSIDEDSFQCGGPENRRKCSAVTPHSVGSAELPSPPMRDAGTRHEHVFEGTLGGDDVSVTVKYKKVRDESSVSNGNQSGGCAGQSRNQVPAALVLVFGAFGFLRRSRYAVDSNDA